MVNKYKNGLKFKIINNNKINKLKINNKLNQLNKIKKKNKIQINN